MVGEFLGPSGSFRSGARGGDGDSAVKPERMIPMNSPAKLSDTQFAILSEASQRKDRCLIPPKTLKAAAAQKVATKLLKAGLVREIKAKSGMEAWRRDDETGQAYSLKLIDAGLKAIAVDERGHPSEVLAEAASGQGVGIELHMDRVGLRAINKHLGDAIYHRDALRHQRFAVIVHRRERQGIRGQRQ